MLAVRAPRVPPRIARQRRRARKPEMRERVEQRDRHFAAVIEDGLELRARRGAVLQLQVRLTAHVDRPEFRGGRVVVRPDRLEQLERAASPRRRASASSAAVTGTRPRRSGSLRENRCASSADSADRLGSPPHSASTRLARSSVTLSRLSSRPAGPPLAPRRIGRRSRASRRLPSSAAPRPP